MKRIAIPLPLLAALALGCGAADPEIPETSPLDFQRVT